MDLYRDCGIELMNIREAGSIGKHSQETKIKMKISALGKNHNEITKLKLSKFRIGKKMDIKVIEKISNTLKNRKFSNIHKYNLSKSGRTPILQYSINNLFINEWSGAIEASKKLNINLSCITACCKGRQKSSAGYIWKYKTNNK